jgi:parvulin-like peptidyl-prolyl isomerase
VSKSPNPAADNMNMIMLSMLQKMQENQEVSNKRNFDMLEQHRLDTEMQLEQHHKDMDIRMEQQRKDMATMHDKIVQNVINQVPLIVHNAFIGMGGVLNLAPL